MTINELIKRLEALRDEHGDVPVRVQSLSHVWDPDPVIRDKYEMSDGDKKWQRPGWVLLNP
jgi:hypothetical protein